MTRERMDLIGEKMSLYDVGTGKSILVERAFDVTEFFAKRLSGEEVILAYSMTSHGEIVQLTGTYPEQKYGGSQIHFQVEDVRDGNPHTLRSLEWRGRVMGINPELLAEMMITHASPMEPIE